MTPDPNTLANDEALFAPSPTTLAGRNADIYFLRAKQIMDAEGLSFI